MLQHQQSLKMIFILKWTYVILIIYTRLYDLKSAMIFEGDKAYISDNSSFNSNNPNKYHHISFNDRFSEIYNNNNTQIFDNKNATALKPTTDTKNQQKFVDASKKAATLPKQEQIGKNNGKDNVNSSCDNDNIISRGDINLSNTFKVDNKADASKWQFKSNEQDSRVIASAKLSPQTVPIGIENFKTFEVASETPEVESLDSSYQDDVTQNYLEETVESLEDQEETNKLDKDQLTEIWQDIVNVIDLEDFMSKYSTGKDNKCLMHGLKSKIQWWAHRNGTLNAELFKKRNMMSNLNGEDFLDYSYHNTFNDGVLYFRTWVMRLARNVTAFSGAYNNLTQVPFQTLSTMANTLKRLTLKGNNFLAHSEHAQYVPTNYPTSNSFEGLINMTTGIEISEDFKHHAYQTIKKGIDAAITHGPESSIAWATFPTMAELRELDMSDCGIQFIERDIFVNITGLRKLYVSHNNLRLLPHDCFDLLQELEYLDLSYTSLYKFETQTKPLTLHNVEHLLGGVKIQATTFKNLNKLTYLDVSHTKMARNSALAFTNLGQNLKFLSLCYTFFPIVGKSLFKHTDLVGIDLSGNPYLAYNYMNDPFEGIADTLKYLFFEESNLKSLEWLDKLENLRLLSLRGNYIYELSPQVFEKMRNLQALDLSYNIIGNWYTQIWKNNTKLRLLNLRQNNLNMINTEMMKDFATLDYLSLSNNNFVCDCVLRDVMEIATVNNKKAKCLNNLFAEIPDLLTEMEASPIGGNVNIVQRSTLNVTELEKLLTSDTIMYYTKSLEKSFANIRSAAISSNFSRMRHIARNGLAILRSTLEDTSECGKVMTTSPALNGTMLKFQLMDYENGSYTCFNGTNRTDFVKLNCDFNPLSFDIEQSINNLAQNIIISICSILSLTLLLLMVYLKRWHIYYYYSSLKSAALLSVATRDQVKKFDELSENDPNMVYDIFISYCQSDRQWVLEELLPNVEEAENISICLHERDFEIGVAILENIISCMDRSRALMLIISSNFLLSHWCQFEMHLAQHRIFEVSKEHLIIVFLEDIPRAKRPKALQYLMDVKTYIKWPGAKGRKVSPEERKYFWKRMRSSLDRIGIAPAERNV